ncbi:hypothetical protein TCAL_06176 [Tigriopus californicus]|uniref:Aminopeptidase N n=1 Tax=Tigriopus californicus TaxID=6832 RepID=A0A553PLC5_TIGCA|nr:glutamyl aminopeptidase-like [Tigriopus californicus]TRY78485.1 hypothetical protein TCAL_06176 [Tigriopus californicus]|eukprot:TCALIF_06176-PA protein Name:"Similar to ANPEP Aminopeptidase N (Bos taurus)" AED:0.05 eAED:0.05 QI:0/1/0.5/1/1/1/2/72/1094
MKHIKILLCFFAFLYSVFAQDFDYPIVVDRELFAKPNDEVSFSCQLAFGDLLNPNRCLFITPQKRHYLANITDGLVYDENALVVPAFTAFGDERTCGLHSEEFQSIFAGQWQCILNDAPAHLASFHIFMEDGESTHVQDRIRLPKHVIPSVYEVELSPRIEEGDFEIPGTMKLHFSVDLDEDDHVMHKIVLHSKSTLIVEDSITIISALDPEPLNITAFEYDLEREFFIIHLEDPLEHETFSDEYTLSMDFVSYLSDSLDGFYRSSYQDPVTNMTKYLAVTQFESTSARLAFPCLDEPDRKAKFNIKLGHKKGTEAVSNMNVLATTEIGDDRMVTEFAQTDIMSTYLLAFLISEFQPTVGIDSDIDFSIYHMPGKEDQAVKAAEVGPRVLKYYEDYFGIDYPLPKMDMAAIPDFSAGAMENWGLITYREATLLYQESISSKGDEDRVVEVIAHELAHQWFGNLVTMKWWTDLWLNEGFATYVENIGSTFILPNNEKLDRVLIMDLHDVFGIDALVSSKPISVEVANPDYDMTYSRLSYGKGNCLIRMIENFITLEVFKAGINQYLETKQHENADRYDLWNALNEVAQSANILPKDLDIAQIMENWTEKEGYPVLMVTLEDDGTRSVRQKRFLLDPDAVESSLKYFIPINIEYAEGKFTNTTATAWLKPDDEDLALEIETDKDQAYILNVKQTGYYRVNYEPENWQKIHDTLMKNSKAIGKLNRAQILDDSFNLARAGQLDYHVPLNLSLYLSQEDEYVPLQAGLNALKYLETMMWNADQEYNLFKDYVKSLLTNAFDDIGFDVANEDSFVKILRQKSILQFMCFYGDASCIREAVEQFEAWMSNPEAGNKINPDLRQLIYEVAIQNGDQSHFNFLLNQLSQVEVDQDIQKIIYGLGHSLHEGLLKQLLDLTLADEGTIRSQDFRSVYRAVGSTSFGRRVQFDWLKANLDVLPTSSVPEIIAGFINTANTKNEIEELEDFIEKKKDDLGLVMGSLNQGLDKARINLKWTTANFETIVDWIQSLPDPAPTTTTRTTISTTVTTGSESSTSGSTATGSTEPFTTTDIVTGSAFLVRPYWEILLFGVFSTALSHLFNC